MKNYDTNILIDMDDKLPDEITLKNVMLMTCVIKEDCKFYPQIFLQDTFLNKHCNNM